MSAKILFVFYSCIIGFANSAPAHSYDQRQTGDLNVQVDLKDLRIFALMKGGKEEYVDYDYAYDYSEMTIKPNKQNSTTPKPLNGSSTIVDGNVNDNLTTAIDLVTEQPIFVQNNSSQILETAAETTSITINDSSTTIKSIELTNTATETPEPSTSSSTSRPMSSTSSVCKKGFVINQKGDCELKLQGAGNALLKLVKLSQKLKLRRENRANLDLLP